MMPDESPRASAVNQTRSPRVALRVPVMVRFQGEQNEGRTINVSAHGALLVMPRTVEVGQSILLTYPETQQEIVCHIKSVARVGPRLNYVRVQFATSSPKFWGIAFPAEDWDYANEEISSEATEVPQSLVETAKLLLKHWRVASWPTFALVVFLTLVTLMIAKSHRSSGASGAGGSPAPQSVAPEDSRPIPGAENYRVATKEDFDPDAILWLRNSGQQASGEIPGSYSAFGESHAYLLIGKDNTRHVVILAAGQLRCDAQYRAVAIVARVPKKSIQKIRWADPPPGKPEGDGVLVVRAANNPGSGVVLFLEGDQVVSGTPVDYRLTPVSQTP